MYDSLKQAWVLDCAHGKITPFAKNVVGVAQTQPPEETGIWVQNASTGERLAGPYESLSDCAGMLSFAAVLAFTKNQAFTVGQTGIVKPLTEHQADALLSTQKEIVSKIDDLSKETQRLEALYQRKIASLDELKKSLLQQAFAGEL